MLEKDSYKVADVHRLIFAILRAYQSHVANQTSFDFSFEGVKVPVFQKPPGEEKDFAVARNHIAKAICIVDKTKGKTLVGKAATFAGRGSRTLSNEAVDPGPPPLYVARSGGIVENGSDVKPWRFEIVTEDGSKSDDEKDDVTDDPFLVLWIPFQSAKGEKRKRKTDPLTRANCEEHVNKVMKEAKRMRDAMADRHDSVDVGAEEDSNHLRTVFMNFLLGASTCAMLAAVCLQQQSGTEPHNKRIDDARRSPGKREHGEDFLAILSLCIAAVVFILAMRTCHRRQHKAASVGEDEIAHAEQVVLILPDGAGLLAAPYSSILETRDGSENQASEEQALLSDNVGGSVVTVRSEIRQRHVGSANEFTRLKEVLDRRKWSHEFEVKEGRTEQEFCARVVINKDDGLETLDWGEPGLGKRSARVSAARIALRSDLLDESLSSSLGDSDASPRQELKTRLDRQGMKLIYEWQPWPGKGDKYRARIAIVTADSKKTELPWSG